MRLPALLFFVTLLAAGNAFGAPDIPDRETGDGAGQHQEKQEEVKDPLQFGPLKVGLDAMIRGESTNNFNFTDFAFTPEKSDGRLLIRVRPSLTFTPNDYLNARVEGQWYAFYNHTDSDTMRLYQGYVEGSMPNKKASLKVGRQELVYGSSFMLGADTFFDGLSFDAVKLQVKPVEPLTVDFFAGKYVKDNSGGITGELYGMYGTYTVNEGLGVELYSLLDTGGAGLTHEGKDERTASVGARLTGKLGKAVAFELEPVYQFGRHIESSSHQDINAFGGHVDLTIDPAIGSYPTKALVSYAFGSGDSDPASGNFTEFHNPNNDTPLIGDTSVIGDLSGVNAVDLSGNEVRASGLHVITAGGGIDLTDRFNVSLDGHYFRAVLPPAGISKDVGFETNLILTYKLTKQVSLLASANRFFTGRFFKDVTGSGKDINYGYLQVQATF
ncbi:alginate export family protein [Geotalea sp. SG265]|uniref:alginate export family protein n=1 Tax=Geotalea sp. SG265 TaxID=2922867 RepID=UPI001FB031AD|nr:alginate export family protein [Geotalea sp. SG265]